MWGEGQYRKYKRKQHVWVFQNSMLTSIHTDNFPHHVACSNVVVPIETYKAKTAALWVDRVCPVNGRKKM